MNPHPRAEFFTRVRIHPTCKTAVINILNCCPILLYQIIVLNKKYWQINVRRCLAKKTKDFRREAGLPDYKNYICIIIGNKAPAVHPPGAHISLKIHKDMSGKNIIGNIKLNAAKIRMFFHIT
jgi:hypothetical protein